MEIWMFADGNCFFFFHQLVKCHCVLWPVYLYVPFRVIGLSFQRFWKTVIPCAAARMEDAPWSNPSKDLHLGRQRHFQVLTSAEGSVTPLSVERVPALCFIMVISLRSVVELVTKSTGVFGVRLRDAAASGSLSRWPLPQQT